MAVDLARAHAAWLRRLRCVMGWHDLRVYRLKHYAFCRRCGKEFVRGTTGWLPTGRTLR